MVNKYIGNNKKKKTNTPEGVLDPTSEIAMEQLPDELLMLMPYQNSRDYCCRKA